MATKKKSAGTSVAVRGSTAVGAVGSWRDRVAQSVAASKAALSKLPATSGNFLSFRGGTITLGGVLQPNPMPVVILAHGFERTYYSRMYQPDVLTSPDCYSFDGVAPHEDAETPQADACARCEFNQFGTAQNGKGKACKEGARFAMIHADYIESPELVASAPIVQARLSVLNSKVFRGFIEALGEQPLWLDITQIRCQPDPKSQYATSFSKAGVAIDEDVLDAIAARLDEAEKLVTTPYPKVEEQQPQKAVVQSRAPVRPRKF